MRQAHLAKAFLEGTPYQSPHEAIRAGAKTLQEWCDFLGSANSKRSTQEHIRQVQRMQDQALNLLHLIPTKHLPPDDFLPALMASSGFSEWHVRKLLYALVASGHVAKERKYRKWLYYRTVRGSQYLQRGQA